VQGARSGLENIECLKRLEGKVDKIRGIQLADYPAKAGGGLGQIESVDTMQVKFQYYLNRNPMVNCFPN